MAEKSFKKLVENKFNVYNSLFLNLPFQLISHTGVLIPVLQNHCERGLREGHDPLEILDSFFSEYVQSRPPQDSEDAEQKKIDFIFRVIQYIERQIVLFDSVEDAAFSDLIQGRKDLTLKDFFLVKDEIKFNENVSKKLYDKITDFSTRIVLTSHPTQFYSSSVLDIMAKLRTRIKENDINGIDLSLHQLGMTSLINTSKPTPLDEAKNIIHLLRYVYYDAIGELYNKIRQDLQNENFNNPDIVQLGFWPGADRDGNPHVHAGTTMAVADELRMSLFKCYYHDVKALSQKLTFSGIREHLLKLKETLYQNMFTDSCAFPENGSLEENARFGHGLRYEEILNPLLTIREILIASYNALYIEDLDNLIDKVKIFQTHFATLDIRQNHLVHAQTVEFILKNNEIIKDSLDELSEEKLIDILTSEKVTVDLRWLNDIRGETRDSVKDTIENIMQLRIIQQKNGERGCNRYIISNSEDIFSVLYVFALFRWCGFDGRDIPFDIIPLFESMPGIKNSESILRKLFNIESYKHHIRQRQSRQTIMLGFSDGTKDGGYLKANWSIFTTKEKLTSLCEEFGIQAIFFDGRGGPPARGGGKTHKFYAAQTSQIANRAIQLTIQGQTITSKYGTKEHFMHNCEQLLTGGLFNKVFENRNIISDEHRRLIERLSETSYQKYTELKNHPLFLTYLEEKSVLKYYGETNVGSRPGKRGLSKKPELSDLRAIPFVGSWSQLKQNVPGYFGIGFAIRSEIDRGGPDQLQKCYQEVPFFKALISNSMMSLYKCNFSLTSYLAKDKKYGDFWRILYEEYMLSKKMLLLISGQDSLMEEYTDSAKSIEIREKTILPLLVIQQYALQKIEKGFDKSQAEKEKAYQKIVKRSLYGSINASRNSA